MRFRNVNGLLGKLELTAASLTPQALTMLGMSAAVSSSRHHIGKVAQVQAVCRQRKFQEKLKHCAVQPQALHLSGPALQQAHMSGM